VTFTPDTARAAGQRSATRHRSPAGGDDRLALHLRDLRDAADAALRAHAEGGAIATALGLVDKALRRAQARLVIDHLTGGAP
jgi:hypothetical protein